MTKIIFRFLALVSIQSRAATLQTSFWVCQYPCEDAKTSQTLPSVTFGYCAEQALDPASTEVGTKVCRQRTGNANARAARKTANGLIASCETSGSECHVQGLHNAVFDCKVSCPEDNFLTRNFSVCAPNNFEAWNIKDSVCAAGREPYALPALRICTAKGETPCTK